jgi:hypothetical protein
VLALEAEVTRLQRDFEWLRVKVIDPLRRNVEVRPAVRRVVARLAR